MSGLMIELWTYSPNVDGSNPTPVPRLHLNDKSVLKIILDLIKHYLSIKSI